MNAKYNQFGKDFEDMWDIINYPRWAREESIINRDLICICQSNPRTAHKEKGPEKKCPDLFTY